MGSAALQRASRLKDLTPSDCITIIGGTVVPVGTSAVEINLEMYNYYASEYIFSIVVV